MTDLKLTAKTVAYLGSEEGLVLEAYKDSKGIWTWAMGVATTGGNHVLEYKDKPQSLETALQASIALMKARYLPPVAKAFAGHDLNEHQIAGALSFEWRNGTIMTAQWVKDYRAGKLELAHKDFHNWCDHGRQVPRCTRECDLFFDGAWPKDLSVPVWGVAKPSYQPHGVKKVDLMPTLIKMLGA